MNLLAVDRDAFQALFTNLPPLRIFYEQLIGMRAGSRVPAPFALAVSLWAGAGPRIMAATTSDPLAALAMHALGFVEEGDVVGLGSGRAASAFVRALAARVRAGLRVRGVATSEETTRLARELGIDLVGLEAEIALTVDGADEVDGKLNLIKGHGGALVRERIVAAASRRQVILVTSDKLVEVLGTRGPLPVEVMPFAVPLCRRRLEDLELKPTLRMQEERPFVTDNFNVIFDCAVGPIEDPPSLERTIRGIPGVIDTGLFLGTADMVVVADDGVVRELERRRR